MKPFIRYYGGKWRAAPRYPKPTHSEIIEPFAGAAGYSLRYYNLDITLVEKYAVLAELWRYLTKVHSDEIRRIPYVEHVDELPDWTPIGARILVGFSMNAACVSPARKLSAGRIKLASMGRKYEGWSSAFRERVAYQVNHIRHWKVVEGDYTNSPSKRACWFIDPPYNNDKGSYYIHADLDYLDLALWCLDRPGQVIVCENQGADWLPFEHFARFKAGLNGKGSNEVMYYDENQP